MIPVLTTEQIRRIDAAAIGGDVKAGYSLMLDAGAGLFDAARELAGDPGHGDVAVVCGKGNNGGDGFAVARLLLEAGYKVMCYCLCQPEGLLGEARVAYDAYLEREGNFLVLDDPDDLENLSGCSLIVDAILGTGIKGNPHGLSAEVIEAINAAGVPVLSADTPSGLDNDLGMPGSPCVKATVTVTMGFPKLGQFFYPGKAFVGTLRVKPLSYPEEIVRKNSGNLFLPESADLKNMFPARRPAGSKFDHGIVLMLAGSAGMTGSAALASMSALRTGCGMVHLASPASAIPVLAAKLNEVVLHPLQETKSGSAALSSLEGLLSKAAGCKAMCIGPGLSHHEETSTLVRRLVEKSPVPVVLDADGINAFTGRAGELSSRAAPLVITPHAGEWARLFSPMPKAPEAMVEELRKKASEHSMTVLYKGNPTIIAAPDGAAFLSPYGNSGMATAGSGDVLAGIISSLAAQGRTAADAAILGACLHGRAGGAAAEELGEYSMIASDIESNIYKAIKEVAGLKK
jgi:ADP-dependent NAD(P)H-hydrate dehydratase / NAD(P)H-hydrate epimerase